SRTTGGCVVADEDTGRCVNCGFLSRQVYGQPRSTHVEVTPDERLPYGVKDVGGRLRTVGRRLDNSLWYGPCCRAGVPDPPEEYNTGQQPMNDEAKQRKFLTVIESDRQCPKWCVYTPGVSPDGHLEQQKADKEKTEREVKEAEREAARKQEREAEKVEVEREKAEAQVAADEKVVTDEQKKRKEKWGDRAWSLGEKLLVEGLKVLVPACAVTASAGIVLWAVNCGGCRSPTPSATDGTPATSPERHEPSRPTAGG
ncbi:MAG: hypothetical protein ABGY75_03265, partial [Gemmataceae bacterium]